MKIFFENSKVGAQEKVYFLRNLRKTLDEDDNHSECIEITTQLNNRKFLYIFCLKTFKNTIC